MATLVSCYFPPTQMFDFKEAGGTPAVPPTAPLQQVKNGLIITILGIPFEIHGLNNLVNGEPQAGQTTMIYEVNNSGSQNVALLNFDNGNNCT